MSFELVKKCAVIIGMIGFLLLGEAAGGEFAAGMNLGYYSGTSIQLHASAYNFTKSIPLSARLSIGYTWLNPGNAAEARKIFINDATNGTPEKHGNIRIYQFDLFYPLKIKSIPGAKLYFGPRHARFKGNFKYIGGNEDFDVTSSQWGWGVGMESSLVMNPRLSLLVGGGIEYYASAQMQGHDTAYSPDGDDVNPREGYTYDDADAAINQPGFELRLMIGFAYRL